MYVQIQWTCKNLEEARMVTRALLEQKLIACANFIPNVESYYAWEGEMEQEGEVKVIFKTRREHFDKICAHIKQHGSYEVPEVSLILIEAANSDYVNWLNLCTQIEPCPSLGEDKTAIL